jgi:hypothetical protein
MRRPACGARSEHVAADAGRKAGHGALQAPGEVPGAVAAPELQAPEEGGFAEPQLGLSLPGSFRRLREFVAQPTTVP